MLRISIRSFLSQAKFSVTQSLSTAGDQPVRFVVGNESADLDSIICAIVYGYIHSSTREARKTNNYVIPVTNLQASELRLRPELTTLLKHAGLKPSDLITLDDLGGIRQNVPSERTEWTLVDHNVLQGPLSEPYSPRVTGVIDHHDDEGKVPKNAEPKIIKKTGSCNSHVVNYCRDIWDSIATSAHTSGAAHSQEEGGQENTTQTSKRDAQVAKLALGAILIDTVNLKDENKVTEHDQKAVRYLEAKIHASSELGANYKRDAFFKEINDAKSNLDNLSLEEILRKDYKQWTEGNITLGISCSVKPVNYLQRKGSDLVPALLDFAKSRALDLYAVMTAHNDSGTFERQLLLFAMEDGKPVEVAKKFAEKDTGELQLEGSDTKVDGSMAKWVSMWEQKNLAASRKQVAPLLREAMG